MGGSNLAQRHYNEQTNQASNGFDPLDGPLWIQQPGAANFGMILRDNDAVEGPRNERKAEMCTLWSLMISLDLLDLVGWVSASNGREGPKVPVP